MGRPSALITDRVSISDQMLEPIDNGDTLPTKTVAIYKPKESFKADLVKEMTNKFFANQSPREIVRENGETASEELTHRSQESTLERG